METTTKKETYVNFLEGIFTGADDVDGRGSLNKNPSRARAVLAVRYSRVCVCVCVWIFLVVNSVCFSPLLLFPTSSYKCIPTQRGAGGGKGRHIIGNARALCWENLVHLPNDS
jgi:hypothetical protein